MYKEDIINHLRNTTDKLHLHNNHDGQLSQKEIIQRLSDRRANIVGSFVQTGKDLDNYIADIIEKCVPEEFFESMLSSRQYKASTEISIAELRQQGLSTDFNPVYFYDEGRCVAKKADSVLLSFGYRYNQEEVEFYFSNAFPSVKGEGEKFRNKTKEEKANERRQKTRELIKKREEQDSSLIVHTPKYKEQPKNSKEELSPIEKVRQNPLRIKNYKTQFKEMQMVAVDKCSDEMLTQLAPLLINPAPAVVKKMLDRNLDSFHGLKHPTKEMQDYYNLKNEINDVLYMAKVRDLNQAKDSLVLIALSDASMPVDRAIKDYGTECCQTAKMLDMLGYQYTSAEKEKMDEMDEDKRKQIEEEAKEATEKNKEPEMVKEDKQKPKNNGKNNPSSDYRS